MNAATSLALALPELPRSYIILGQYPESNLSWRWVVMEKHDDGYPTVNGYTADQMTTYGQQCAQAQGEADAAEIARLKALLERCKEWHQGDKWRDGSTDKRQAWEAHMRDLDAALKSEAA